MITFEVFPAQIVSIFGNGDALYMEFATLTMRIYLSGIVFTCVQKGCGSFMQAVGLRLHFLQELSHRQTKTSFG